MSTSTVKLYYSGGTYGNWELNPGRLLKLDNIASYLAGKSAVTKSSVQYIKNDLEITIKLDMSQSIANPKVLETFKYCSIQNTGEQIHYYFIKKPRWRSLSCVEFELVLDVLNTFEEGTDYDFKANTNIIREHKSRFKRANFRVDFLFDLVSSEAEIADGSSVSLAYATTPLDVRFECKMYDYDRDHGSMTLFFTDVDLPTLIDWITHGEKVLIDDSGTENIIQEVKFIDFSCDYFNIIDYIPEGINPILQHGDENTSEVVDSNPLDQDWYLLYRNQDEPDEAHQFINPVDCYLIPGTWRSVKVSTITAGKMNSNSLEAGKYYMVKLLTDGVANVFTLDDGTDIGATDLVSDVVFIIIYRTADDRIAVQKVRGNTLDTSHGIHPSGFWETKNITINHLPQSYKKVSSIPDTDSYATWNTTYNNGTSGSWTSGDINVTTDDITDLDRTDSRNIKVIKLPYCPYDFTITGGMIDISSDNNWEYSAIAQSGTMYALKLLKNITLEKDIEGFPTLGTLKNDDIPTPALNDTRIASLMDPKLWHSEFHKEAYFYDSFEYDVDLEKMNLDYYIENEFDIDNEFAITFTMTKTINSKFMFTFKDCHMKLCNSNLPLVMPVARNNEEVLYNIPYINYIRTGFNYDVKAKNLQVASNIGSLALAGGSMLVSLLLPSIPLKVAGIVGSIASFANSIKNAVVSAQATDNNIQRNLEEKKRQTDSVSGSDDVDLMTEYCGNRLRYASYEPNPTMKAMLNDLFFYCGYRSGRMGKPNHINRVNFDYLECDPQFENIRSIPSDCLEELAKCFKSGVTYLHQNAMIGYDFDQSHENWERFLFD